MITGATVGAAIAGVFTLLAAIVGGLLARRTKRTREPLSWENMLARLAAVEERADALQGQIEQLRRDRDAQDEKIRNLNVDLGIYRSAFRALWTWADRLRRDWSGPMIVPGFTLDEQAAVDLATAEPRHALPDDPWKRSALPPRTAAS